MFTDGRSRRVALVAHCFLNQNAISDGTAIRPAAVREVTDTLLDAQVGILQMPCPELCCLGLDRGDADGGRREVTVENTRIRRAMEQPEAAEKLDRLVEHVAEQVLQYRRHGFEVVAVIGANRSPCCGVDTTSDRDREVAGRGVFMERLARRLRQERIDIPMVGLKDGGDMREIIWRLL